jgi:hypothetical protein
MSLPPRPNKEYLKKLAADRFKAMLRTNRGATLRDAQPAIADAHGFRRWKGLTRMVDAVNGARTALQSALDRGDPVAVKRNSLGTIAYGAMAAPPELDRLLALGADSNACDWNGDTFLHWVIRHHPIRHFASGRRHAP